MTKRDTCPSPGTWRKLVAEGFADVTDDDALGEHLDGCPLCQAAVESLMRGQNSWLAIAAILRQELPPSAPACARKLEIIRESDPPQPEPNANGDYAVANPNDNPHKSDHVTEYVQYLERRAKQEAKREPYKGGRLPIELITGLFFIFCGLFILSVAFLSGGSLFVRFVREFLVATGLILVGMVCIIFWKR